MPPLVSRDSAVRLAIRLKRGISSAVTGVPSPFTNAGAASPASMPSSRRSSRQRSASEPRQLAERHARRVGEPVEQPSLPGDQRLALKQRAQRVQLARASRRGTRR